MASFKFLATSLTRSFQEFQPQRNTKVRKRIQATAQLYWNGEFYLGEATEIGVSSLRLELPGSTNSSPKMLEAQDLQKIQQEKPLVGLLLSQEATNLSANRLLAQIVAVEVLSAQANGNFDSPQVAIELTFPEQFKQRQTVKIKQLLKVLR